MTSLEPHEEVLLSLVSKYLKPSIFEYSKKSIRSTGNKSQIALRCDDDMFLGVLEFCLDTNRVTYQRTRDSLDLMSASEQDLFNFFYCVCKFSGHCRFDIQKRAACND